METVDNAQEVIYRSTEELINNQVAYSDMTDEEIGRVVEWKAELKARDEVHAQVIAAQQAQASAAVTFYQQEAQRTRDDFDALLNSILK